MFRVFHLDVANLIWMLHILLWLYTHVSSVFFKCFICFQSYVASVLARYFISRSGGAHVAMAPVAGGLRPAATAYYCCWGRCRGSPCGCLRSADASAARIRKWMRQACSCLLQHYYAGTVGTMRSNGKQRPGASPSVLIKSSRPVGLTDANAISII
jgi:hypothetical protein